jgi:hypothetical protein
VLDLAFERRGQDWVDDGSTFLGSATWTQSDGWTYVDCTYTSGFHATTILDGAFALDPINFTLSLTTDETAGTATLNASLFGAGTSWSASWSDHRAKDCDYGPDGLGRAQYPDEWYVPISCPADMLGPSGSIQGIAIVIDCSDTTLEKLEGDGRSTVTTRGALLLHP